MTGHETLRDLRESRADRPPRVRRPLRDRVQAEPQPDQGDAAKPGRRPRLWRILWRVAAAILIAGLGLTAVWVLAGTYTPPDPAECAALYEMTTRTPDVVYEMDRIGCDDPPYERLNERRPR